MTANAEKKQGNNKFQKGQSGNPKGKTKGTKNKATLAAETLLEGELDNICKRLVQEALAGNIQAIKMVLDRILPSRRDYPVTIELPKLQDPSDALQAIASIAEAVSSGNLSPSEGEALSRIIDVYVKAIETHDYEKKLNALEQKTTR